MIKENRVKRTMAEGKLALAGYVTFADPNLIEIMGIAGLDAAFIDMEHSNYDLRMVSEMIRACDLAGITSVVRPPENDWGVILRLLDMGAQGIYIPHVNGVVRYPPLGHRGAAGGSRAAGYGSVPWQEHMARSNEEIFLAVMVEDQKAIDELDEIAALDGLDVVSVGPTDLSATLGVKDPHDPKLQAAVKGLADRIQRAGKARLGFPVDHPACPISAPELVQMGTGYSNMAPTPTSAVLNALRQGVANVRNPLHKEAIA